MSVTFEQWQAARHALAKTGSQFAELVATSPDVPRAATKDWSVGETAAHVVVVTSLALSLARPGQPEPPLVGLETLISTSNVDTVATFNDLTLQRFTERDPQVLAKQLENKIDELLSVTDELDPALPLQWLGDAQVPVAGLLAHLLNEFLLHGRDIAGALRRPWVIPPEGAAMFLELFLYKMIGLDYGRLLDHGLTPPKRRIAVQLRSEHTTPTTLVLDHGRMRVAPPDRNDDVVVRFDPATLMLMLFGRISQPRAVATGKVSVRGRRPWLLLSFLRYMHMPGRGRPRTSSAPAPG